MNKSDCHRIGTLVKLYGYKGEYVLALDSYFGEEIENWESVFIDIDGLLVPFFIAALRLTAETTAIVSFDDVTSDNKARRFLNYEVYQLKALAVPENDKRVTDQLNGYDVIDRNAGKIGRVVAVLNYNQNLLLQVLKGAEEILIPIAEGIIVKVNHKKKEILIAAPEGLFELNN